MNQSWAKKHCNAISQSICRLKKFLTILRKAKKTPKSNKGKAEHLIYGGGSCPL